MSDFDKKNRREVSGIRYRGDAFKEYAIQFLEKKDIPALLSALRKELGCRAAYRDFSSQRTDTSTGNREFNEYVRSYPLQELRRFFTVHTVGEERRAYGYLITETTCEDKLPLIQAALLGIRLLKRREIAQEQRERAFEETLLRDILTTAAIDRVDVNERLSLLGISSAGPCFALAVLLSEEAFAGKNDDPLLFHRQIADNLRTFFPKILFVEEGRKIFCALFPGFGTGTAALRSNLENLDKLFARRLGDGVFIGAGSVVPHVSALRGSMKEAERSLVLGRLEEGRERLFLWRELGAIRALGTLAETEEGKALHDACLQKVIEHDEKHGMDLLLTLAMLERHNWNFKAAAESLSFHINTVKYRYAKLCDLLGTDLRDASTRFNVSLALRLHGIYELERSQAHDNAEKKS